MKYVRPAGEISSFQEDKTIPTIIRFDIGRIEEAWERVLMLARGIEAVKTVGDLVDYRASFHLKLSAYQVEFEHKDLGEVGIQLEDDTVPYLVYCQARAYNAFELLKMLYEDTKDERRAGHDSAETTPQTTGL